MFFSSSEDYIANDDSGDNGTSVCILDLGEQSIEGESYFTATMTGTVTTDFKKNKITILQFTTLGQPHDNIELQIFDIEILD